MLRQPLADAEQVLGLDGPTLLVLGRPSCDDCAAWYAELDGWPSDMGLTVLTLDLTTEVGHAFKAANAWTEHIDFIPFNVLYRDGDMVAHWTGGGIERLMGHLNASEA
jgi:hypothetical protein